MPPPLRGPNLISIYGTAQCGNLFPNGKLGKGGDYRVNKHWLNNKHLFSKIHLFGNSAGINLNIPLGLILCL